MPSVSTFSPETGILPTPSPELGYAYPHANLNRTSISHHPSAADNMFLRPGAAVSGPGAGGHNTNPVATLPTWEVLRDDPSVPGGGSGGLGTLGAGAGMKRGHDSVEDFFTDMKKRRVAPSYDPRQ